jgi:pyrroloquinoline quinone biosynthesis protein B
MRIHVLGAAAAGGGFPQWNCNCRNCDGLRRGEIKARARTQSSIAVSGDGERWVLINASPDIRAQILASPALQPQRAARDTGIAAVLLTDAQIDHVTGLLLLREGGRLPVYCTEPVHQDLTQGFPVLSLLEHYCGVDWRRLELERGEFEIEGVAGIAFTAVPLSSKAPPYSPHRHDPHPGDNIGLVIRDVGSGKRVFYAPGLGEIGPEIQERFLMADCLLVDGTFWREDEMLHAGVGKKLAAAMGHLPQSGPGGMIEHLNQAMATRKILIHINNTNPILDEDSPERAALAAEGIEVAFDGMEIEL